jgi:hypothetical protein
MIMNLWEGSSELPSPLYYLCFDRYRKQTTKDLEATIESSLASGIALSVNF